MRTFFTRTAYFCACASWATSIMTLLFLVHFPTVAWAQHHVREAKREHRRKHHKNRHKGDRAKTGAGKQFTIALFGLLAGASPDTIDDHALDDEVDPCSAPVPVPRHHERNLHDAVLVFESTAAKVEMLLVVVVVSIAFFVIVVVVV